jgi:hypothetical protein
MRAASGRHEYRRMIAGILLASLILRALVPAGFMPAPGHGIGWFQICPDGFPSQLLSVPDPGHAAHHAGLGQQHHHGSVRSEHCVFAALASAGPTSLAILPSFALESSPVLLSGSISPVNRSLRHRVQQPRAPPIPA